MQRKRTNNLSIASVPGNLTDDALWCTSRRNLWRMSCRLTSANRSSLHSSVSWIYTVSPALLKVLIVAGTTTSCSWGTSCSCAERWWDIAFSNKCHLFCFLPNWLFISTSISISLAFELRELVSREWQVPRPSPTSTLCPLWRPMMHQRLWRGTSKAKLLLKWKKNASAPNLSYVRRSKLKRWWTTMSMIWVILCSVVKEIHPWQSASLVFSHKSQAARNRVWLFLPRPLISTQAPLSTPFPIIWAGATALVLVHCYCTRRTQTTVHLTLGTNCRFAKVSLRLLCRLYSPSKTPSFLRPPLPFRWTRFPSSENRWISILIPSFLIKDLMATGDWKWRYHRDRATRGQQGDPSRERLLVHMDFWSVKRCDRLKIHLWNND